MSPSATNLTAHACQPIQTSRYSVVVEVSASRSPNSSGGSTNAYSAGFTITGFEADFFGRLGNLSEAAQSQLLASVEARKTVQISLIASVANSYLSLLADDDLLRLTRETLASREESLRLTRLTFDAGVISGLDLRGAEQQLLGANANIGAARAAFLPRITLTTSIGTASNQLSGLFRGGSFGWSFAPQIILPIFDGGRNQANLDAAKVGRDIAVAQYEKTIQSAFREVADALASRATLADQLRSQTAQAKPEQARLELVDLRFNQGTVSAFERLDAQRATFAVRQAVVQLQLLQAQNLVAVYKTLGGGWTN